MLQQAHIDTLWLGSWSPTERANLIEACEVAGINVVGPNSATTRRLGDPDVVRELPGGGGKLDPNSQIRSTQVVKTLIGQRRCIQVRPVTVMNSARVDLRMLKCVVAGDQIAIA